MARFSLRARLLLAVSAIALCALVVADVAVYSVISSYLYRHTDAALRASHIALEQAIAEAGRPGGGPPQGEANAANFCEIGREAAPGMFVEVLNPTGSPVAGEACAAFEAGGAQFTPQLPRTITGFSLANDVREPTVYFTVSSRSPSGQLGPEFRVRASKLPNGGTLLVANPIGDVDGTLRRLLLAELAVGAAALAGAIVLGLVLVRIGLRPLRDIAETADAISTGDLVHRVPNANPRTEVGHLATAFNVMVDRIEHDFVRLQESENRLRRFVSDASHELRTPIAAVSAYAELFRQGASRREADLQRTMEGIERESARMGHLVEELLVLARLDEHRPFVEEPIELVGLAAEAIETARTVGPDWPIELRAGEPVEVAGDHLALRQVIDNLLGNVRAHTPPGTRATLEVWREGGRAMLRVSDEGPGLTDEQAKLVFERFFRADPSRARATGGSGLGLAIVASIVRAHGGDVAAGHARAGGAVFTVWLPLLAEDA